MTELLDFYLKKLEKKKEARRIRLLRKVKNALGRIRKDLYFKEAYIFGSILKPGRFYNDSDIDIAVNGLKDKDFFLFMARLSDMAGEDVDVLQLEKHRLKDKIMKEGLLWKKQS